MGKGLDNREIFRFSTKGIKSKVFCFLFNKKKSLIQHNKGDVINKTSFLRVEYIIYNLYVTYI